MSTRNIKDAKDLSTNELIYFKGHAQATYMSDGRTVEEAVNSISGGSGEDSDVFIFDLFGWAAEFPNDTTNTGTIEFGGFPAEFMSMIDNAIQKNKLVVRVDCVDLYNLEIDTGSTIYLIIHSYFKYMEKSLQVDIFINRSELNGTFSISPVNNTGLGGSSNVATINLSSTLSSSGGTFTAEEQAVIFDTTIGVIIFNNSSGNKTWVLHRDSTNPSNMPIDPCAVFTGTRRTSVTNRSLMVLQVNRDGSYTYEEKNLMFKGDVSSYPIVNASTLIGANGISNGLQLPTNTYCTLSHGSSILAITLQTPSDTTVVNEYLLEITLTGTPTISFPSSIKWVNGETPTFESGNTYQISIVNNLAVCVKFQ